jgi:uncharacterized phage-associated protein
MATDTKTQPLLITHEREKLLNAIIFFANNTRYLGKTKLFKLLYFLDFEHFKEIGRSVTGLDYFAWKMGPVPSALMDEIEAPEPDMLESLVITESVTQKGPKVSFEARIPFDNSYFTRRELRIMNAIADEFRDATADEMVEATHDKNLPWHTVYETLGLHQEQIPYELAVDEDEREMISSLAAEREAFVEYFKAV